LYLFDQLVLYGDQIAILVCRLWLVLAAENERRSFWNIFGKLASKYCPVDEKLLTSSVTTHAKFLFSAKSAVAQLIQHNPAIPTHAIH
jgi:hypothetical protein